MHIAVGAYDGAEISELVGLLILNKTKENHYFLMIKKSG